MLTNPRKRVLVDQDLSTSSVASALSNSPASPVKRHKAAYDGSELPKAVQNECARLVTNDPDYGKRGDRFSLLSFSPLLIVRSIL